jgi:hypothetical protein
MNASSQFCSLDRGCSQSLSHLFFVCEGSLRVWCAKLVGYQWLFLMPSFLDFSGLQMRFLNIKNSFKVIWLVTIWKAKNGWILNQKVYYVAPIIHNIKL